MGILNFNAFIILLLKVVKIEIFFEIEVIFFLSVFDKIILCQNLIFYTQFQLHKIILLYFKLLLIAKPNIHTVNIKCLQTYLNAFLNLSIVLLKLKKIKIKNQLVFEFSSFRFYFID